eukprot:TRINITY_DN15918_c0_g1_i1.p1 TRINITY_DN15918_c0_g1~~TRINITY_DN15918_c0_g1_i1.p1  ORF type:complete len:123 (-),score=27.92 TRINITY_DN15918_c0_g1_i1:195-563(-)
MALGPFARILAQVAIVAGGAIGRAALSAYKEAAAGRGGAGAAARAVRRQMSSDEARKVLNFEADACEKTIQERFELLHKLNEQTEHSPGSPYLQARIVAARTVLLKELRGGKSDGPSDAKVE